MLHPFIGICSGGKKAPGRLDDEEGPAGRHRLSVLRQAYFYAAQAFLL